jgi:hypothetical protein
VPAGGFSRIQGRARVVVQPDVRQSGDAEEIISAYVRSGWSRNAFAPHDGTASRDEADGNIRSARVEADPASRAVYIDLYDTTFIC